MSDHSLWSRNQDSSPSSLTKFDMGDSKMVADKITMNTFGTDVKSVPEIDVGGKRSGGPTSWKDALFGFTQNTTLHGIRFIFMDDVFILRRLIWLLLFLTCSVLMSVQIIERIVYYYGYPVTVNVDVNFNKTLAFPSVTICNQNTFKATSATESDVYRLIEHMHSQTSPVGPDDLKRHGVSNMSLADLYLATAHRKEDLIVSCEWQGKPCGPDNFTEILTDHGVCYDFNDDPDDVLWVTSTGADYGLKLTLNVEQYEYMPGPHDAAGLKILLHDQKESPKVAELGLAVPTGTHTYVGIQLLKIRYLPAPHGMCQSEQSPYYKVYSPESCELACITLELERVCGCRDIFMPHIEGQPSVCTLEQYVTCYTPNIAIIKERVRNECACPVPCDFLIYDPTMSFASTSIYATDRLLADTSTTQLRERLNHAREITSRMDRMKYHQFEVLEQKMRTKFDHLKSVTTDIVRVNLNTQKDTMDEIYKYMDSIYLTQDRLMRWQEYHVLKNFMRARNAMEERTLFFLALGFQEFSFQIESRIRQMARQKDNFTYPQDVRTALYLDVTNLLYGRVDLAERAYANYSQLYGAYYNGTYIFRYQFESEPRDDNPYITPRPLLRGALFHNSYARIHSDRFGKVILGLKDCFMTYSALANKSYLSYEVNEQELHNASVTFLMTGRTFHFSKSIFYSECIEYPASVINRELELFERKWRTFRNDFHVIYDKVLLLLSELDSLENTIIKKLNDGLSAALTYLEGGNVTKMSVAEDLTSESVYDGISSLKLFFASLRSRGQNVYDGWGALLSSANSLWEMILADDNLVEYYNYKNMSDFLRNYTDVSKEYNTNFTRWRDEYDVRFLLGNVDSLFFMNLNSLMTDMQNYIDTSHVDSEFIRKNFLQLDIFYREKSYEQITQQEAYDLFALLCDIGGSMGLFVGASVMTICEIVDLGIHHSLYRLRARTRLP